MNDFPVVPQLNEYEKQTPFRTLIAMTLPTVFDNELSTYELLNKVVDYLNTMLENVETVEGNVAIIYAAYIELHDYVEHYFDNLDVQEEINNKLDQMATSGELLEVLLPAIPDIVTAWLDGHVVPTSPIVDDSLTISGAAADSKTVGDRFTLDEGRTLRYYSTIDTENINNMSDITGIGAYFFPGDHIPLDIPNDTAFPNGCVCLSFTATNPTYTMYQILIKYRTQSSDNAVMWIRNKATATLFTQWRRITTSTELDTELNTIKATLFRYYAGSDAVSDLNDITMNGNYIYQGSNLPDNLPSGENFSNGCCCIAYTSAQPLYNMYQIVIKFRSDSTDNSVIWVRNKRTGSAFTEWRKIITEGDIPDIVGGYFGQTNMPTGANLDALSVAGAYYFPGSETAETTPLPDDNWLGGGVVCVFARTANPAFATYQMLFNYANNNVYVRHRRNTVWTAWANLNGGSSPTPTDDGVINIKPTTDPLYPEGAYLITSGDYTYQLSKVVDATKNMDAWNLNKFRKGGTIALGTNRAQPLGVIKFGNSQGVADADYSCGAHGYEHTTDFRVYCDGVLYDGTSNINAKKICIYLTSDVYRNGTNDVVCYRKCMIEVSYNKIDVQTAFIENTNYLDQVVVNRCLASGMLGMLNDRINAIMLGTECITQMPTDNNTRYSSVYNTKAIADCSFGTVVFSTHYGDTFIQHQSVNNGVPKSFYKGELTSFTDGWQKVYMQTVATGSNIPYPKISNDPLIISGRFTMEFT